MPKPPCTSHAECNDGTYCDLDGTCFGCEWCAQSLDAIDGACPSKCGGVTKLVAGSTFPSDRSELESSGPVREPVEPGCPAFHRLVRNSNPEIDFSERSLAAPYDDARRMSERLASKVDLLAEEMAARPEHFGEYTLHVEQAYTVANKSVTTDISWHNAARAAKVTLIKLDERRRRARWEQRGGSANNISRLSLEAVAYSNRSWDAGSGSSLLRRRRQVACPAGYYDTTSGKAEYWSCGCACPGGCFTDGDCNCACKSINDAGETCTDVLVFRQTAGTYLSKEAWKSVNPDDPENDNYSILDTLEDFRDASGKFEFTIKWPAHETPKYNRWTQTSNPTYEAVAGYSPVDVQHTAQLWAGLEYNKGLQSLADGSVNNNWWYYAIGSTTPWGGGVPGADRAEAVVELYVHTCSGSLPHIDDPVSAVVDLSMNSAVEGSTVYADGTGLLSFAATGIPTPALYNGIEAYNMDNGYITTNSKAGVTVGQRYTHAYWINWRESDSGWRTLFRNSEDHCALVEAGSRRLGVYSNRNGAFRLVQPQYDIVPGEWTFLVVVGKGDSATSSTGKSTFYVGSQHSSIKQVGVADRVCSGTKYYRLGWPGQGPGKSTHSIAWNRILTEQEIERVYLNTLPVDNSVKPWPLGTWDWSPNGGDEFDGKVTLVKENHALVIHSRESEENGGYAAPASISGGWRGPVKDAGFIQNKNTQCYTSSDRAHVKGDRTDNPIHGGGGGIVMTFAECKARCAS